MIPLPSGQLSLEAEKTWLQYESERWGLKFNLEAMACQEESQSTPALIHIPESSSGMTFVGGGGSEMGAVGGAGGPGSGVPENNLRESCTRLSISLEENGLYKVCTTTQMYM
nr:uncharacterized protein LOC128705303 [Cherax quadricarinatus]